MQQINDKDIVMKPRLYFSVLSIVIGALSVLAGLILAYCMSMSYFWLRIQTADTMAYGARRNLSEAMSNFPWGWVLAAVALSSAAIWLLRSNSRMYRHRTVTVLGMFILLATICSLLFYSVGVGKPNITPKHSSGTHSGTQHHRPHTE
jgi:glucan phosphoethanolaminetransferase (alkaline phosphatase superfamily)